MLWNQLLKLNDFFYTGPSDLWNYSFYTPVYNFTRHRLRTTALFRRLFTDHYSLIRGGLYCTTYLIQHDVVKFSIDWFTDHYSLIRGGLYCTMYLIQHDVVKFSIDWFTDYSLIRGGLYCTTYLIQHDVVKFSIDWFTQSSRLTFYLTSPPGL